jgi:peptidoglycan/xylan/chitin deacetylase (PgdA/CDA1 family)
MSLSGVIKNHIPESLLLWRLKDVGKKQILLTFDDGPDESITLKVLDILDEFNAKAIFFVVGRNIHNAPEVLKEIIGRGHLIGNHTFIHSNSKQPGFITYLKDIKKCQKEIYKITQIKPKIFRAALGVISPTTIIAPKLLRLQSMQYSLVEEDWRCKNIDDSIKTSRRIIENVSNNDILLLHDNNKCVLDILKIILPELQEKQYDMANAIEKFR